MLKRFLLLLLCVCPWLPRTSKAQALSPLRSIVVALDSGDVARRAYICLDSATYRVARQQLAAVPDLRQRVTLLTYDRQLLEQQLAAARREGLAAHADFTAATAQARQLEALPTRPPLLLDGRVYTSAGAGVLLALLYSLLHP